MQQAMTFSLSYDKAVVTQWKTALKAAKDISKVDKDALRRLYTVAKAAVSDKDKLVLKLERRSYNRYQGISDRI
jgi:vacuolar-type H+-ATPase catalytic subunit A/Vma1